ncbi:MAG: DUF805 domain-containing protein [Alphaproteobacteria bacterium]|nr:DUF805 domain-containing protein [Alphaproteobacteria bacterium]
MGFGGAVAAVFRHYAQFSGRSRRAEYWYFYLFCVLVSIGLDILSRVLAPADLLAQLVQLIFALATLIPSISVGVRRLHDIDRTGWWMLLWLVPFLGWIVLIVFACLRGTDGPNRFGPDPLATETPAPGPAADGAM